MSSYKIGDSFLRKRNVKEGVGGVVVEVLERECMSCGRKLRIEVYDDGTYSGGHYFATLKIPKESLTNPSSSPNYRGEKGGAVLIEYWECDECFAKDGSSD